MKKKMICLLALTLVLTLLFALMPAQAAGTLELQDGVLGIVDDNGVFTPLVRNGELTNMGFSFFGDMPAGALGALGSQQICGTAGQQAAAATLGLTTDAILSWEQIATQVSNILDTLISMDAERVALPEGYATLKDYVDAMEALQDKLQSNASAQGDVCMPLGDMQSLSGLKNALTGASAGMDFSIGSGGGGGGVSVDCSMCSDFPETPGCSSCSDCQKYPGSAYCD